VYTPGHLQHLPNPVVRDLPRSSSGNSSRYTVFGKTYTLLADSSGYESVGNASWYGTKFHGRPTASGEAYDMYALTAAHKRLPIPCYARITNLSNNRSTIVKVNDRGPFHGDRIVDVSYAAAVKLGFAKSGTTRVHLEVITPRSLALEAARAAQPVRNSPASVEEQLIFLQAGAFSELSSASSLKRRLVPLLGNIVNIFDGPDKIFRVSIGPLDHMREANRIQQLLVSANFAKPFILLE